MTEIIYKAKNSKGKEVNLQRCYKDEETAKAGIKELSKKEWFVGVTGEPKEK